MSSLTFIANSKRVSRLYSQSSRGFISHPTHLHFGIFKLNTRAKVLITASDFGLLSNPYSKFHLPNISYVCLKSSKCPSLCSRLSISSLEAFSPIMASACHLATRRHVMYRRRRHWEKPSRMHGTWAMHIHYYSSSSLYMAGFA